MCIYVYMLIPDIDDGMMICMYADVCMHTCIYVYMYICIHV